MGNADKDLLAFVLRHGEFTARVLAEYARDKRRELESGPPALVRADMGRDAARAEAAARDLAWLYRVNRPDWSHDVHTDTCMSDDSEAGREGMTAPTVEANHRLHMGHVGRIDAALRAQR